MIIYGQPYAVNFVFPKSCMPEKMKPSSSQFHFMYFYGHISVIVKADCFLQNISFLLHVDLLPCVNLQGITLGH